MKRVLFALCLIAVTLFFAAPGALAKKDIEVGQVTSGDKVNLRAQPGTDQEIIGSLSPNEQVEVLDRKDGWLHVIAGNQVGYVREDLVFVIPETNRVAYVTTDGVKLRGGPGQSSYVIDELAAGGGVKVKRVVGEWYFVSSGGQAGYVHKSYLQLTRSLTGTAAASGIMLRRGMTGEEVTRMQKELVRRGFMVDSDVTGSYGTKTGEAVKSFQKAAGFDSKDQDGVAGPQTLELINDRSNGIKKSMLTKADYMGRVQLLSWFSGGDKAFPKGATAVVHDVRTGREFRVRRFGGWYHADSEPLAAKDTEIFKKIAGGKWTWDRRAIWVKVGSKVYAGSMNCMPHLPNPTKSNNFPGHFCIHFYKSKVHENSKECPRHQAAVQYAYSASKKK